MKIRKILALVLIVAIVAALCVALAACGDKNDFKIGLICLHDENSTYDKNFIDAFYAAAEELGISKKNTIVVTGIPEGDECYQKACELADMGCKVVFADSFGHEEYMIKAAKQYPDVQFCHATGTMAHTEKLDNFANAFASIYEGRYLAGVAAGLKLNEMIANGTEINGTVVTAENAKIGYVGAFTYAEVMSGYTSFFLGARSICPTVTMEVTFTGSWYDETAEKNGANSLIERGCNLISQHADSMGAPNACEAKKVPNVSYNGSTKEACPNTFIVSSRINWAPYYKYVVNQVKDGKKVDYDYTGTIATGSVVLTDVNTQAAAAGTEAKIKEVKEKLLNGQIKVFDTDTFTVNGAKVTTYLADVDTDAAFTGDTEVISNGAFLESVKRSAPYFNLEIDGITLLDRNYGN